VYFRERRGHEKRETSVRNKRRDLKNFPVWSSNEKELQFKKFSKKFEEIKKHFEIY
jgi:hypothetical protein